MKKSDFARIKIRHLAEGKRRRLKDGRELCFEVSVPKSLNGGRRFRSTYATREEAEAVQAAFINKIKEEGVSRPLVFREAAEDNPGAPALAKAKAGGLRLSGMRDYYLAARIQADSATAAHVKNTSDFFDLLLAKFGDIPVQDLTVPRANQFLSHPPPTESGEPRHWSTGSRTRFTDTGQAIWNWIMRFFVDDRGVSPITYNPWLHVHTAKLHKRGQVKVHTDCELLKLAWRYCEEKRWDMIGVQTLRHHCGLRVVSDIAGGDCPRNVIDGGRTPLTYGAVHLEPIPGYPHGFVDVVCYKTEGRCVDRRMVALDAEANRIFQILKAGHSDDEPILQGSVSAFNLALHRCMAEASMDLYGRYTDQCQGKSIRDLFRHSCLTSWANLVDDNDRSLHTLSQIALWAGHGMDITTLKRYYVGVMTPAQAAEYRLIGVSPGWILPPGKPGTSNVWHPDEARRAWWWATQGRKRYGT